MKNALAVVAVYREGTKLILVDAKLTEHEASNGEELWLAMNAIADDKTLPQAEVVKNPAAAAGGGNEQIFEEACQTAEHLAGDAYGPLAARAAGHVARHGGKGIYRWLRRISR